jgi:hypothetical protein
VRAIFLIVLAAFAVNAKAQTPGPQWVIYADMFEGCGYKDAGGNDRIYKDCTPHSWTIYWTGTAWTRNKAKAARYASDPADYVIYEAPWAHGATMLYDTGEPVYGINVIDTEPTT